MDTFVSVEECLNGAKTKGGRTQRWRARSVLMQLSEFLMQHNLDFSSIRLLNQFDLALNLRALASANYMVGFL